MIDQGVLGLGLTVVSVAAYIYWIIMLEVFGE
jgi:hypothetical protein